MAYFKVSYQTLKSVASSGEYADVAAFLVMARHADGRPPAGLEPHRFSGAGVNAVHEKGGLSEESARAAVLRLQRAGVIRPVPPDIKELSRRSRWEIQQDDLDLDLPHRVTDSIGPVESALRRIKTRAERPQNSSRNDSQFRLDVLMTLLAVYQNTSMSQYGGLTPVLCSRQWEVLSHEEKLGGIRWGCEPRDDIVRHRFVIQCVAPGDIEDRSVSEKDVQRFQHAWKALKDLGLIYEAVSLFEVDPIQDATAQLYCTLRVNDYHAGATYKAGDPSLLRLLEIKYGTNLAFYTQAKNERDEEEAMWLILPFDSGALIGIWRPRFRPENQDVGRWLEQDAANTEKTLAAIDEMDG